MKHYYKRKGSYTGDMYRNVGLVDLVMGKYKKENFGVKYIVKRTLSKVLHLSQHNRHKVQ